MSQQVVSVQQATSIEQWLKGRGFQANPFADQEADRERRLPEYFVETPFYDDILGDPANPRSLVVFAGRGCGKSAHRFMVARACRPGSTTSKALAVEYTSFGGLAEIIVSGNHGSLLRSHVSSILRALVDGLMEALLSDPVLAKKVPDENLGNIKAFWEEYSVTARDSAALYRLLRNHVSQDLDIDWGTFHRAWLANQLVPTLRQSQLWPSGVLEFLVEMVDVPAADLNTSMLSSVELLEQLVQLARASGLEAVYVLVDRVDESHLLAARPDLVAAMLVPLIGELPLMECPGSAFKFFLPVESARLLMERSEVRSDRVLFRELRWEEQTLRELLIARLSAFSEGKIGTLGELCEPDLARTIDMEIVIQSSAMPRNLLRLAEELVYTHCQKAGEAVLLTRADWHEALNHFHGLTTARGLRSLSHPPLHLYPKTRKVAIGSQKIPLSETHYKLLRFLAERAGQVVPNSALWDIDVTGSSDALRTAVKRIRQAIEPDPKNPIYLITVRGEGLRLDNVIVVDGMEMTQ